MHNGKTNSAQKNRAVTSKSYLHLNQHPRRCPKYAIVRLAEGTNVLQFYQLLLENGQEEVSFVNKVREHALQQKGQPSNQDMDISVPTSNELEQERTADDEQKQQMIKQEQQSPKMVDKGVQVTIPERSIFASPSFNSSLRTQLPVSPILRTAKKGQQSSNTWLFALRDASNLEKPSFD